ncbi:MAG TPA: outer membrane lipoprotein carrier protein LolA, partial [Pseudonocardiaceae bacterium]
MKLATAAVSAAAVGAIGLGAMTVPALAGSAPSLPPVSPEDLVASVLTAKPPAFGGTVEVDNALGLPSLPGMGGPASAASVLTQPTTTFRAWSDGQGRGRLALPSNNGEQVLVEDG